MSDKHLAAIASHLKMNSSDVTISEDDITQLLNENGRSLDEWIKAQTKNESVDKADTKKESTTAKSYILNENELRELLKDKDNPHFQFAKLRGMVQGSFYNKISGTTDGDIWKLMKELGYFK